MIDAGLGASWAAWAGCYALPIFFVLLGLLLAASYACWRALQRYATPRRAADSLPSLSMGQRVAAGIAVVLTGVAVFAALAAQLAAGQEPGPADQAFADALRAGLPQAALLAFSALTYLGDKTTLGGLCIAVALALIARRRHWLALGWVVAVVGNSVLNRTLKQIFGRVRPLNQDGLVLEPGFSFPSGHSSGSVVAYGMLAYLALRLLPPRWHLPTLLAMAALAFTVGASRVFLTVHFASDVIAGFASGTAWLAICVTGIELMRWRRQRTA
ncbi:MAG: phosphatase PAP2 family protein [Sulfuritalea sp.]|jgi:undecaprenyl-diphosphatase|nr:phosphatase PAP2 family protein [Sulfuritalea sp.]